MGACGSYPSGGPLMLGKLALAVSTFSHDIFISTHTFSIASRLATTFRTHTNCSTTEGVRFL
jgi:hypothetical protein